MTLHVLLNMPTSKNMTMNDLIMHIVNSSKPDELSTFDIDYSLVVRTALMCSLTVVIVLLNTFMLATIMSNPRLRASVPNRLIASLAVSDLLIGIIVVPLAIVNEQHEHWPLGRVACEVWLAIDVYLCTTSIYNLFAISLDRYLAVFYPMHYKLIARRRITWPLLTMPWLVSVLTAAQPLIMSFRQERPTMSPFVCSPLNNTSEYILISSTLSYYAPLSVICILYSLIYHRLRTRAVSELPIFFSLFQKLPHAASLLMFGVPSTVDSAMLLGSQTALTSGAPTKKKLFIRSAVSLDARRYRSQVSVDSSPTEIIENCYPIEPKQLYEGPTKSATKRFLQHNTISKGSNESLTVPRTVFNRRYLVRQLAKDQTVSVDSNKCVDTSNDSSVISAVRQSTDSFQNIPHQQSHHNRMRAYACARSQTFATTSRPQRQQPTRADVDYVTANSKSARMLLRRSSTTSVMRPVQLTDPALSKRKNAVTQAITGTSRLQVKGSRKPRQKRSLVRTVVAVLIAFVVCWSPFFIVYSLNAYDMCTVGGGCMPQIVATAVLWLGYVNSAINPLIYSMCGFNVLEFCQRMRRTMKSR